jgi:Ni,Fe-hydrogenase III small subunit
MRPLRVYLLDTGGCGACAAEVWTTVECSPELAWAGGPPRTDVVVLTGSLPTACHETVLALYEQFWRGRVPVVAAGRCAVDGYPYQAGGVRALKQLEVAGKIDVCPPLPELILELLQGVSNGRGTAR